MYKTASRNLQKARGRDVSSRVRIRNYAGRREARIFFYPVIFHAAQHNLSFDQIQSIPGWLKTEIERLDIVEWLERNVKLVRVGTIHRLKATLRPKSKKPRRPKFKKKVK